MKPKYREDGISVFDETAVGLQRVNKRSRGFGGIFKGGEKRPRVTLGKAQQLFVLQDFTGTVQGALNNKLVECRHMLLIPRCHCSIAPFPLHDAYLLPLENLDARNDVFLEEEDDQ